MDQMILSALAIVTLCWGARMTPWRTVKARVRFAQGFSLRRLRTPL
jgi:hypothetical protein